MQNHPLVKEAEFKDFGILVIRSHVDEDTHKKIMHIMRKAGMDILRKRMLRPSEAEQHVRAEYKDHKEKEFYEPLVQSMIQGQNDIKAYIVVPHFQSPTPMWKRLRDLAGATDPREAREITIRGRFGNKDGILRENCVHTPDSEKATLRSYAIWFEDDFSV